MDKSRARFEQQSLALYPSLDSEELVGLIVPEKKGIMSQEVQSLSQGGNTSKDSLGHSLHCDDPIRPFKLSEKDSLGRSHDSSHFDLHAIASLVFPNVEIGEVVNHDKEGALR